MEKLVSLYWFLHGLACFESPWMAFLAISALVFSLFFDYKRKVYSRRVAENTEADPKGPILNAIESLRFWCSAILSFVFLLRFLVFAYCMYWILGFALSMLIEIKESVKYYTPHEAFSAWEKLTELKGQQAATCDVALVVSDALFSSFQLMLAYGFYIVQAWKIRKHNLYENDPWVARLSWVMVILIFFAAYMSEGWLVISIILLRHIHNFFSHLQTMLNQREDSFGKRLILSILWPVERLAYGFFKVGVPGFLLVVIVGSLATVLFFILVLRGIGALEPPSSIYIE